MAIRKIEITNDNTRYYRISPRTIVLGRLYDNKADTIQIVKPAEEADSVCTMIFTDENGEIIENVVMDKDEWEISSSISQYSKVQFGFSFAKPDGYIKNSEIGVGTFLPAIKPEGFIPESPDEVIKLNYLIAHGFTDVVVEGNAINFYNLSCEKVGSVTIEQQSKQQSNLAEIDESKESFVKGKSTKNLINEGADGTSPYATLKDIEDAINLSIKTVLNSEV